MIPRVSFQWGQNLMLHRRKENSSEIPARGIYRSVKLFSYANQIARNKHNDDELVL